MFQVGDKVRVTCLLNCSKENFKTFSKYIGCESEIQFTETHWLFNGEKVEYYFLKKIPLGFREEELELVNQLMTEDDIQIIFQNKEG